MLKKPIDKKLFKNPVSILEEDIDSLFSKEEVTDIDFLFTIINMIFFKKEKNTDMIDLLKNVGVDNYIKSLYLFEGRTITFPKVDQFLDSIVLAICYYYRTILNKSWDEIQNDFPSYNIQKLSMALRIHGLDEFIKQKIQQLYRTWEKENK